MRRAVPALALVVVAPGCQLVFEPDPGNRPDVGSVELVFESAIAVGDLPLPVRITPDDLDVGAVEDPKTDLRFVGADGEDRPFEVERWSPDGESVVWVLPALFDEGLTLYYGEGAGGVASAADVWSSGWAAVWHMSDGGPTGSLLDSTGVHAGLGEEPTFESGQIGLGRTFGPGASAPVTLESGVALFGGWTELTIEAHIRPVFGTWIEKGDSIDDAHAYTDGGVGLLDLDVNVQECSCWADSSIEVELGTWTHVAYTYDGATVVWYHDGEYDDDEELSGGQINANPMPLVIGTGEDGLFQGALDEVRISNVYRSPQFVHAAWATAAPTFVTIER